MKRNQSQKDRQEYLWVCSLSSRLYTENSLWDFITSLTVLSSLVLSAHITPRQVIIGHATAVNMQHKIFRAHSSLLRIMEVSSYSFLAYIIILICFQSSFWSSLTSMSLLSSQSRLNYHIYLCIFIIYPHFSQLFQESITVLHICSDSASPFG